ncbi:MAG: TlpA family protein disulfide reductase [Planctomycetota bacterium]
MSVDGDLIGSFYLSGLEKHRTLEFKLIPQAGDPAPDITMVDAESLEEVKLSDFRGQVVYLEFWATWCGPCQQHMAELDALWQERRSAWEGKVALVPLSLNSDVEPGNASVCAVGRTSVTFGQERARTDSTPPRACAGADCGRIPP